MSAMTPTAEEILKKHASENGFDGLFSLTPAAGEKMAEKVMMGALKERYSSG